MKGSLVTRRSRQPALLTGPAAAGQLGLDGFADRAWPLLWCGPQSLRPADDLIRTTSVLDPVVVGDVAMVHPALVLRHLGCRADVLSVDGGLTPRDRVELAVEHALREGLVTREQLHVPRSRSAGDALLREVLSMRGDEPPAESYAEVRAIQLLRAWGLSCWRQVHVHERGRIAHRVDLVVPFDQRARRPALLTPADGLLVEIDSRQFHEHRFEEDRSRQITYDLLGFAWITFTPNQLEHQPDRARRAFEVRYRSAKARLGNSQTRRRNSQGRKSV